MSLESLQQNYADAIGYVLDRTVTPPKYLGQAFLVSKSRAVTCASILYNYTEAPWALTLHFPHPNVTDFIKSITLHNDFDKVAARKWYLAQTGTPGDQLILPNDMASLTLDFNRSDLDLAKVGELQRALSLPFTAEGVEASGNIRPTEFLDVLVNILQSQRTGLLTLIDSRNIPIARIQVAPGLIQKCYYRSLLGEIAFFELVYRKPAEGYYFQPISDFNWGNVRDITAPADALLEEAERRVAELPSMLTYLGGNDARYTQRVEVVDVNAVSENVQWLLDRLWGTLDGYMTVDKMSERVGADTYSVIQAMRELVNRGLISMINRATPFHCNGQVGSPLISHTDFEVNAWDPLQSFYLDNLSGKPTWAQGNFFGVANALQPKNMLHTIPLPNNIAGSLILKDYKLIGVHSAPHVPKAGQPTPPVKLYQMMWMGALLEMSSKRKVGGEEEDTQGLTGLRTKMDDEVTTAPPDNVSRILCPNCFSSNTQAGPCFNCGTMIEVAAEEPEPEDAKGMAKAQVAKLQKKLNLTKPQMAIVAAAIIGFPLIGMTMCGDHHAPEEVVVDPNTPTKIEHRSSDKAVSIATKYAGFKGTAVPGYWYEDTLDKTKPSLSFGLYSEQSNQKVIFLVNDDMSPVNDLTNFVSKPPCTDLAAESTDITAFKIEENNQILGDGNLHWFVGKYASTPLPNTNDPVKEEALIGAYPSPEKGKSIIVLGRALKPGVAYDYKTTLWLCDQMAEDYTAVGNATRSGGGKMVAPAKSDKGAVVEEKPAASEEEIDAFVEKLQPLIQEKLKLPDDIQELLKKKKPPKIKTQLAVKIDEQGNVTKLEITKPGDYDTATGALQRAVTTSAPFTEVPHTKAGEISVLVTLLADVIKVERP